MPPLSVQLHLQTRLTREHLCTDGKNALHVSAGEFKVHAAPLLPIPPLFIANGIDTVLTRIRSLPV